MNRILSGVAAAVVAASIVGLSPTSADAAVKKYVLGDHPAGALTQYNDNYGLRWDDAPGGRKVFSFELENALVKMHIDDTNSSASVFGSIHELTSTGGATGIYWDLNWNMTGLSIDGGIEKYFELNDASGASGTLSDGTTTHGLEGKLDTIPDPDVAFFFRPNHRGVGPAGAGWFDELGDGMYPGTNDFLFTAILDESDINPVPVPAALPLFLTAMAGLGFMGYRRRGQAA